MIDINWRQQGSFISVRTANGAYTLRNADAETRRDILALLNALVDAGQGVGGGWPVAFTRGWINE